MPPGLEVPVDTRPLTAPAAVPPGLPSELLQRRPDIQQADAPIRAAFQQLDFTRKSARPILVLTGSIGSQNADLIDLVKAGAPYWSIAPTILVSIYDLRRRLQPSGTDEARARRTSGGGMAKRDNSAELALLHVRQARLHANVALQKALAAGGRR